MLFFQNVKSRLVHRLEPRRTELCETLWCKTNLIFTFTTVWWELDADFFVDRTTCTPVYDNMEVVGQSLATGSFTGLSRVKHKRLFSCVHVQTLPSLSGLVDYTCAHFLIVFPLRLSWSNESHKKSIFVILKLEQYIFILCFWHPLWANVVMFSALFSWSSKCREARSLGESILCRNRFITSRGRQQSSLLWEERLVHLGVVGPLTERKY